jgi:hypothetical protein
MSGDIAAPKGPSDIEYTKDVEKQPSVRSAKVDPEIDEMNEVLTMLDIDPAMSLKMHLVNNVCEHHPTIPRCRSHET